MVLVGFLVFSSSLPAAAQSNCTTKWNQFLGQHESNCTDGSRTESKYNPFLKQWESTTTPGHSPQQPYRPQQRCIKKYNEFLRQWETNCR